MHREKGSAWRPLVGTAVLKGMRQPGAGRRGARLGQCEQGGHGQDPRANSTGHGRPIVPTGHPSILGVVSDAVTEQRIEALLEGLNPAQRDAVTHGEGPLLILAGAGSGKTRVLTHRIAYLVHSGLARPDELLAITFTNKAAQEMRERVELLLGRSTRGMWVLTFHAACTRMLRVEAPRLGYTRQFTIYDQADSRRMVRLCLDQVGADPKRFTPGAVQSQISDAKNRLRDAAEYRGMVGSYFEQTVADAYELYERELVRCNAMDFDDLLVRAVNVLELFPEVRERYQQAFEHVLVDEYQDTNHAQYRWLTLLAGERRNLAVVGDDAQSVYGFRGADIRNILDFEDDFPDAHVVKLEQNYRSTQTILSAANAVIAHNRNQVRKELWTEVGEGDPVTIRALADEHAEARAVLSEIEQLVDEGVSRSEIAVFYRTNAQSRVLEDALVRADVPYQVIGGTKFYDRAEIKDAIAYLSLLANPSDQISFTRVANSPRRGIGQTSLSRVIAAAATLGEPVWDVAAEPARVPMLGPAAIKAIGRFMDTMGELRELAARGDAVGDLLEAVLHRSGYLDALEAERTFEAQGRIENLEELVGVAREFDGERRGGPHARRLPRADRAGLRRRHPHRRPRPRHADDAAQREGPRVPDRLHHRLRGGRLPALALAGRGVARGGAAPLLRRHHPRDARADAHLRAAAHAVRRRELRAAQPLPRRDPAGARRPRTPRWRRRGSGPRASSPSSAGLWAAGGVRSARDHARADASDRR